MLLLEDNPGDRRLVQAKLAEAAPGRFLISTAERLSDALAQLQRERFDVVLSDLTLPDSTQLNTVNVLASQLPRTPLVVLTGSDDDAVGNQAVLAGAQDYLIKNDASGALITRALRYAIERKKFELDLRDSNARLDELVNQRTTALTDTCLQLQDSLASATAMAATANDAIITADERGCFLSWNPAAERIFGYTEPEVMGEKIELIIPQRYRQQHAEGMAKRQSGNEGGVLGHTIELTGLTKQGLEIPIELSLSTWNSAHGQMYAATIRDITERKRMKNDLLIAAMAFESQESILVTDAHEKILRINRACSELTGYAPEEVIGQTPRLFSSGRHGKAFYREMWANINGTGLWRGEVWNRKKSGEIYPEWLSISAVRDDTGKITNYIGSFVDISQRKSAEEAIHHLAFYDALTDLPNRSLLLNRLRKALLASTRNETSGALFFIDLDDFKTLNDTAGHDSGDRLLITMSKRILENVRQQDTVSRFGGDEFVVMMDGLSQNPIFAATQARTAGNKILEACNQPFELTGYTYRCSASIGIVLFGNEPSTVEELLKRADLAMYQAKASGRNALRFFDPVMQSHAMERMKMETELRQGLAQSQMLLYYQPQIDANNHVTGAEALVRWQHPQHGLVPPFKFIPLAEETGLIVPMGQWILRTACAQLAAWSTQNDLSALTLAVNISARQFSQADFVDLVISTVNEFNIAPHKLKLELTESLLISNVDDTVKKMVALKSFGVSFSLDDFGTGYSSLSYLKRLPLDQLKIDQSFVRDIMTDPNDAAIAQTIVTLAECLGLQVIAEGVETQEQRDFLSTSGCNAYQGYLFSKPVPIADFDAFCRSRH